MSEVTDGIRNALFERFGEKFEIDPAPGGLKKLARLSARCVCRRYEAREVPADMLRLLCACAL